MSGSKMIYGRLSPRYDWLDGQRQSAMAGKSRVRRKAASTPFVAVPSAAASQTVRFRRLRPEVRARLMEDQLTADFATAVHAAIADAGAAGLAVSGYENGIAVELLPDGTKRPIDEAADWSPVGWKHR